VSSDLIELVTLFERTSKNGVIYLVGRWGPAKLLLMPGDDTQEGQPTWRLLIGQAAPKSTVTPKPQPPPSSQFRPSGAARARVIRKPAAPRAAGPPLPDDPVSDLWGEP
jgi:hypothetical protein